MSMALAGAANFGQQPPVNAWEHVRQVLGNQAGTEFACRISMQPDPRTGRLERRHALGHEAANDAREDVPRSCGRQTGRAVFGYGRPLVRCGHDTVGAFIDDDSPAKFGRQPRFLKLRMRLMIFLYLSEKT